MFKKFFNSSYVKAALVILVSGSLLIVFSNWVEKSKISIGFDAINKTLMPVYIGIVFAFLLCPIYNSVVKHTYKFLTNPDEMSQARNMGARVFLSAKYDDLTISEQNRKNLSIARFIATIACLLVLFGSLALVAYFVVPQFIQSLVLLVTTLPQKLTDFSAWLASHLERFPIASERIELITKTGANEILDWVQKTFIKDGNTVELATTISTSLMSLIGTLFNVFVGVLIMVYLLNNKDRIFAMTRKLVKAIFSERKSNNLFEFSEIINETFLNFISGRIMDSVIIGILTYFTLSAFSLSFAPMISVLVGVTNIIPFFGPFIGAIPSALILLIEDPRQALYFIVIILVIQQLDGNVIGPKIVGNAIGISSFWVLISVLIGGGLFGFLGMALGVPVFAVIYKYVNKLAVRSLAMKDMDTATDDYFSLDQYDIDASEVAGAGQVAKKMAKRKKNKRTKNNWSSKSDILKDEPRRTATVEESLLIDTSEREGKDK